MTGKIKKSDGSGPLVAVQYDVRGGAGGGWGGLGSGELGWGRLGWATNAGVTNSEYMGSGELGWGGLGSGELGWGRLGCGASGRGPAGGFVAAGAAPAGSVDGCLGSNRNMIAGMVIRTFTGDRSVGIQTGARMSIVLFRKPRSFCFPRIL